MMDKLKFKLRKKVGGFTTIEYCLLMPILLLLYTFIIYMGVYQYNRCLLQTNTYILGLRGAEVKKTKEYNLIIELQKKQNTLYNEKYLLADDLEINFSEKNMGSKIEGYVSVCNPFHLFGLGEEKWIIESECKINGLNPVNVLFLAKNTKDILENLNQEE